MYKKEIEYFDGDQRLVGQLIHKNDISEPQPAVIIYHAFEGLGEFVIEYAEWLAQEGYVVFAVDMYGDGYVASDIEDCFRLITPFLEDRSLVRRRARLAWEVARNQELVLEDKIGSMGFCFGGMCVLELARSGADFKAGVSAHGVLAKSDELVTEKIKASLLVLHGYKDPQVPPKTFDGFAQEMIEADVTDWTFTMFGNAAHSFTDPRTGSFDPEKELSMGRIYDKTAAERTYRYAVDFFKEIL